MSVQPLAFTGISKFSADFQKILNRAVSIASVPLTELANQRADGLSQKHLLSNLNGAVAGLAGALRTLGELGVNKAVWGSSSNPAKVTVTGTTASAPASYTLSEITSLARAASATSAGYATSGATVVSATGTVKITFRGVEKTIVLAPEQNNLIGLRDRINELGLGVVASVLTTGTGPNPYYLSLTATTAGWQPITLVEDPAGTPVNLLATADEGANAVFKLNGVAVSKPSNLINDVVPGISFHLAGTTSGSETVTLTLASDRSRVAGALQSLASAYNHVSEQLDAQIGETAGLLSGNHLIREVQTRLRAMTGYQGTGSIRSLAELGFQFDERGKAKFDPATLDALSDSQIQAAFAFLGSSTTGLGSFAKSFQQLSDSVTGLIKLQQDQYDMADKRLSEQIAVVTERITALQSRLSAKLQAADALLATLEQQQSLVDASVKSLQLVLYGRQEK